LEHCSSVVERQIVVHDKEGPYLMDAAEWPKLTDPEQMGVAADSGGRSDG
jgi:hypothetical protein